MSYARLRGRIKEYFGTEKEFSEAMKKNPATISAKLNNNSTWKREDIEKACTLLEIPIEKVHLYFFEEKLGNLN